MRRLGYILLFAGFLWVGYDSVIGLASYNSANARQAITQPQVRSLDPETTRRHAFDPMWRLYHCHKARELLLLAPTCLMFLGALILSMPREPEVIVRDLAP